VVQDDENTPAPESGNPEQEVSQQEDQIYDLEMQLAEKNLALTNMMVRAAEAENALEGTLERVQREAAKTVERKHRGIIESFLEVMDNFDRALESEAFVKGRSDTEAMAVIEGVKLVRQSFLAKLAEHGVQRMNSMGATFDPELHDALSSVPAADPSQNNTVVGVVKEGYTIGESILRVAAVAVAKS
jgi:molecular chaperone GrpE